jgi:hypothetical protein
VHQDIFPGYPGEISTIYRKKTLRPGITHVSGSRGIFFSSGLHFWIMRPGYPLLVFFLIAAVISSGCMELDLLLGTIEAGICTNADLSSAGVDRDHCIQDAAIRKSDEELCRDIERPPPESKCYMLIAEKERDPSYCENLEDNPGPTGEYSRFECLQRVAIAAGDPSICDKMGSASASMMIGGVFNKESCLREVGTGKSLTDYYEENKDRYEYCQDLAYTQIFRKPPDSTDGLSFPVKVYAGGQRKAAVGERLLSDYDGSVRGEVEKGSSPSVELRDGDIIVFGFDDYPDPKNAPHYAVVEKGKVRQVLAFGEGGALDQPRDIGWFFDTRTVHNPYTGNDVTSKNVYQYYIVYHKK